MWLWLLLLIIISAYNAFYGFLPESVKAKRLVKVISITFACLTFCYGIAQIVINYNESSYAYVSGDGKILRERNFHWNIQKDMSEENSSIFIIEDFYTDSNRIKVKADQRIKVDVSTCFAGTCLKIFYESAVTPNFEIHISY